MLSVFEKMGIAEQVKGKLKQTPSGVFVGTLKARPGARLAVASFSSGGACGSPGARAP